MPGRGVSRIGPADELGRKSTFLATDQTRIEATRRMNHKWRRIDRKITDRRIFLSVMFLSKNRNLPPVVFARWILAFVVDLRRIGVIRGYHIPFVSTF
jgi:hypothetical protein